jgi:hypothetical protein
MTEEAARLARRVEQVRILTGQVRHPTDRAEHDELIALVGNVFGEDERRISLPDLAEDVLRELKLAWPD